MAKYEHVGLVVPQGDVGGCARATGVHRQRLPNAGLCVEHCRGVERSSLDARGVQILFSRRSEMAVAL